MQHAITVADVLKVGGGVLLIAAVVGGFFWVLSKMDFSH